MGVEDGGQARGRAGGCAHRAGLHGRDAGCAQAGALRRRRIGYPVMLKAAAGGGGKGMRFVQRPTSSGVAGGGAARGVGRPSATAASFWRRRSIAPRHVEVQILADTHGNVIHLGERDCSIQRRHQKVVEESPSRRADTELRATMGEAAVRRRGRRATSTRAPASSCWMPSGALLLPGDEHAAPGGASRDRVGARDSISCASNCASRRACRWRDAGGRSLRAGMPSRCASMPKIPPMATCHPRARCWSSSRRARRACAWIPASPLAVRYRSTMIRCWRS